MLQRKNKLGLLANWIVLLAAYAMSFAANGQKNSTWQDQLASQTWNTENGLPQNSVHAILQTRDGLIWLGTEGGLARFDDYRFQTFDRDSTPRLPGTDIRCLLADKADTLWVGTANGLTRLHLGVSQTYGQGDGLPSASILALVQTGDGRLWVSTTQGLASTGTEGTIHFVAPVGVPNDSGVQAWVPSQDGSSLWVLTSRGIFHLGGADHTHGQLPAFGSIEVIAPAADGSLLLAGANGLQQLGNKGLFTLVARRDLPPGKITKLVSGRDGIWVATRGAIALVRGRKIAVYKAGRSFAGTQVLTLLVDRQGTLWLGTNHGLSRSTGTAFETVADAGSVLSLFEDSERDLWVGWESKGVEVFRHRLFQLVPGIDQPGVTPTAVVQSGKSVWVGTSNNGLLHRGSDKYDSSGTKAVPGFAGDTILAVAPGATTDDLWVGTAQGLSHVTPVGAQRLTAMDGLIDDYVRSVFTSADGDLWIGTQHGLSRLHFPDTSPAKGFATPEVKNWTTADGLGSNVVGSMLQDASGTLWVATRGGLSQLRDGLIRNYTVADGLPGNAITALATAPQGALWIGTNNGGLAHWSGKSFFSYAKAAGLPKEIYGIVEDGTGWMWIDSDHGIFRVRSAELQAFQSNPKMALNIVHYGTADGLPSVEAGGAGHPAVWRGDDGTLWFVTSRGVVAIEPHSLSQVPFIPRVAIDQIMVDGREGSPASIASVAPGATHFSFSFAGISFAAPQQVQYRYRLRGFDPEWIETGTRRTAFYTNLPPGTYHFQVGARVAGGEWSEVDSASDVLLVLRPQFHQTVLFRAGIVLLFVALLILLYRLRLRAVRIRFDAVSAERTRLAREIHDTLAQGFVAVSVQLEIMSQLLRKPDVASCRTQLDDARTLVRESLAEARRSIWDLRSQNEAVQTLPTRLARTVQDLKLRGTSTSLETTGVYRPLNAVQEEQLSRIAQEAAVNSHQHASPSSILIALEYSVECLTLSIVDDGRGFDPATASSGADGHFGIVGMQERAREIGATVHLASTPGKGSSLRVVLPLAPSKSTIEKANS